MKTHLIPEPQPIEPQREQAASPMSVERASTEPARTSALRSSKPESHHHSADAPMRGFLRTVFAG